MSFEHKVRRIIERTSVSGDGNFLAASVISSDVVVYGATASGVLAACAAARSGVSVLLVSTNGRVGGMVTGGLARTDYRGYNPRVAMNVMTAEFWRRCAAVYGMSLAQFGMDGTSPFAVEPKVAQRVFNDMLSEYSVRVIRNYRVITLNKQAGDIKYLDVQSTKTSETKRLFCRIAIEASYGGDVLMRSGVDYSVGREANATYSETYNGVRASAALTGNPSPYVVAGDAGSGLLPYVDSAALETAGTADSRIQAYCHRLVMTNDPAIRKAIPDPASYHPEWYELLGRSMAAAPTNLDQLDELFYRAPIPLGGLQKQDWNNQGAISLDFVGGNFGYATTDYVARDILEQRHTDYTLGLFKFLREDTRVPTALKTALSSWGFCADEFIYDNSTGMSPELYVRESARMVGDYVMTEANWAKTATGLDEPIALVNYAMDSHPCSKRVVGGVAHAEGGLSSTLVPVGYYGFQYRAMLPKSKQCGNLLVCCNGVSASHTVFGSIRMEVTFMSLGEAAGVAAAMAINGKSRLHDISGSDIANVVRPYLVNPARVLTVNAPNTNGVVTLSSVIPSGWGYATFPPEFYSVQLVNEGNGNKGGRWVQFAPTFAEAGRHRILLNAPGGTNSQLRCRVDVVHAGGTDTLYIDHKFGEWHFRDLGVWTFTPGAGHNIRVTNAADPDVAGSGNGLLNVDAIGWHKIP